MTDTAEFTKPTITDAASRLVSLQLKLEATMKLIAEAHELNNDRWSSTLAPAAHVTGKRFDLYFTGWSPNSDNGHPIAGARVSGTVNGIEYDTLSVYATYRHGELYVSSSNYSRRGMTDAARKVVSDQARMILLDNGVTADVIDVWGRLAMASSAIGSITSSMSYQRTRDAEVALDDAAKTVRASL